VVNFIFYRREKDGFNSLPSLRNLWVLCGIICLWRQKYWLITLSNVLNSVLYVLSVLYVVNFIFYRRETEKKEDFLCGIKCLRRQKHWWEISLQRAFCYLATFWHEGFIPKIFLTHLLFQFHQKIGKCQRVCFCRLFIGG